LKLPSEPTGRLAVAITGASGAIYAASFLRLACERYSTVYLTLSETGEQIVQEELGVADIRELLSEHAREKVKVLDPRDLWSPPASGSHEYDGLVVVPCSVGTLGRIAAGVSDDLVTRCADVCLKERRKLILVVRETPLNLIQIRNMATVTEAGGVVLPACPAFYQKPSSLEDLANFIAARIARQLGLRSELVPEWGETGG